MKVIWVKREEENFLNWDWTAQINLIRFNKSGFSSIAEQTPQSRKNLIIGFSYLTAPTPLRIRLSIQLSVIW